MREGIAVSFRAESTCRQISGSIWQESGGGGRSRASDVTSKNISTSSSTTKRTIRDGEAASGDNARKRSTKLCKKREQLAKRQRSSAISRQRISNLPAALQQGDAAPRSRATAAQDGTASRNGSQQGSNAKPANKASSRGQQSGKQSNPARGATGRPQGQKKQGQQQRRAEAGQASGAAAADRGSRNRSANNSRAMRQA